MNWVIDRHTLWSKIWRGFRAKPYSMARIPPLPIPCRITYKLCMIMFKCLRGSAPAYLADYCNSISLMPGRSALRSAAHGDIVVPSYRTDWGLRSFAVAGPSS